MTIDENTPIAALTVRQFSDLLRKQVPTQQASAKLPENHKYVFGLSGIRQLFNVSHSTAHRYKETILKDACKQQGRKILVDVEKAMELFSERKGGRNNE